MWLVQKRSSVSRYQLVPLNTTMHRIVHEQLIIPQENKLSHHQNLDRRAKLFSRLWFPIFRKNLEVVSPPCSHLTLIRIFNQFDSRLNKEDRAVSKSEISVLTESHPKASCLFNSINWFFRRTFSLNLIGLFGKEETAPLIGQSQSGKIHH